MVAVSLLVPIVLSAVIVFIASALVWMVAPHHKHDWKGLSNEEATRAALNASQPAPGMYMIPFAGSQETRKDAAFAKRMEEGPTGFLTLVRPGNRSMRPMMVQSLVYYLIVSYLVAYLASSTLPPGTHYLQVFRVVGTAAWLGYGFGMVPESIWFGRPWHSTFKRVADALFYALLTAGTFGWLWPA